MARRGISGPPRSFITSGEWPDGVVEGPAPVLYAVEVSRRLTAAIDGRSLRDVAAEADLDHTTLWAVLRGERWPDLVTIAKLETSLGVRIWPD